MIPELPDIDKAQNARRMDGVMRRLDDIEERVKRLEEEGLKRQSKKESKE